MEVKEILNCDAIISDVDGTIVKGRMAYSGKSLIKGEIARLHLGSVYRAIKTIKEIEKGVSRIQLGSEERVQGIMDADNWGLEKYHLWQQRNMTQCHLYRLLQQHTFFSSLP